MTTFRQSVRSALVLAAGAACLALGAGCSGAGRPGLQTRSDGPVTRGVPGKPVGGGSTAPRSAYDSAALDLQALFDRLGSEQPAPAAEPGTAAAAAPEPNLPLEPPTLVVALEPEQAEALPTPPPPQPAPKPEPTPREQRLAYAKQLAQLLVPAGEDTRSPLRAALPLIALETIQPGVAAVELERLMTTLNEQERRTVETVRSIMAQLDAQADRGADPRALADAVRGAVDRAQPVPPPAAQPELALGTVALCRKVEAFGRFTAYAGSSFLAGRRIPMVVYAEVENYSQARQAPANVPGQARGTERWSLELSQEVRLYAADGSLQWYAPEQAHKDVSQSQRRDFFLVQRIDLPASLSVGRYTLKVIVRDKAAAKLAGLPPDSEPWAEVNIPIQIVADAGIAGADSSRPVATGRMSTTADAGLPR